MPIAAGLKLYIDSVNANGGINGRQVTVDVQDNACTSAGGVTAVQKLIASDPQPVAILGGFCSDATLSVIPIIDRAQVPLLVDGAANSTITTTATGGDNRWVYRWVPDNGVVANATIENLKKEGITSVAIVADTSSYGSDGADALEAAAKEQGIEVLSKDLIDLSSPDFASVIARLENEKPGAVATWITQAKTFYDQYGQSGLKDVPLAGQVDLTQKAIETYGLHGWKTYQYAESIDTPENKAFIDAWTGAGNKIEEASIGYDGYEAGQVIVAALKSATDISPAGVRDALKNLTFAPTLAGGEIVFDENGQAHDNVVNVTFEGTTQTSELLTPGQVQ